MLLFVDVESSDLLKDKLPLTDPSQPWAVSIAAALCDYDGNTLDFFSTRIRADGRMIRPGAAQVHGITNAAAATHGINEIAALGYLCGLAAQARRMIGHGIAFDRKVLSGVIQRRGKDHRMLMRPGLEVFDTMIPATAACQIPSKHPEFGGGYKWASLDEAGEILCGLPRRSGKHTAWDDIQRTIKVYFEVERRGLTEPARTLEMDIHGAGLLVALEEQMEAKRGRGADLLPAIHQEALASIHAKQALTHLPRSKKNQGKVFDEFTGELRRQLETWSAVA